MPRARLPGALGGGRARRAPPGGALGRLSGLAGEGGGGRGEEPGQWQPPPLDPDFAAAPSGGSLPGRGVRALGLEPEHGGGDWEDVGEGEPDFDFDVRRLLESLPGLRAEGVGLQLHGEALWPGQGGVPGGGGGSGLPGQSPSAPGGARPGAAGAHTAEAREQRLESEGQLLERGIQGQYATDLLLSSLDL